MILHTAPLHTCKGHPWLSSSPKVSLMAQNMCFRLSFIISMKPSSPWCLQSWGVSPKVSDPVRESTPQRKGVSSQCTPFFKYPKATLGLFSIGENTGLSTLTFTYVLITGTVFEIWPFPIRLGYLPNTEIPQGMTLTL